MFNNITDVYKYLRCAEKELVYGRKLRRRNGRTFYMTVKAANCWPDGSTAGRKYTGRVALCVFFPQRKSIKRSPGSIRAVCRQLAGCSSQKPPRNISVIKLRRGPHKCASYAIYQKPVIKLRREASITMEMRVITAGISVIKLRRLQIPVKYGGGAVLCGVLRGPLAQCSRGCGKNKSGS